MRGIITLLILNNMAAFNTPSIVRVFHFMIKHWAPGDLLIDDTFSCGSLQCIWKSGDQLKNLRNDFENIVIDSNTVTLGLYNIHSWWERTRSHRPNHCDLPVNLTMAETEESFVRYNYLFDPSFKNFDGNSSTHPSTSVPRVYKEAYINASDLLPNIVNFSSLIKAASYVASDCHRRDAANSNRDAVVQAIREHGFRVDGLGRCMRSIGPEGIQLPNTHSTRYNLIMKRETISKFMFYLAFENSIEKGYVTEKPFDGLVSGTVPIYLGDTDHLKNLIPHPKAVIFLADYNGNYTALVDYLNYLASNETAYEEHRQWRHHFTYEENIKKNPLLQKTWVCQVCEWAANKSSTKQHNDKCEVIEKSIAHAKTSTIFEGQPVRGSSKELFLLKNSTLHHIPNLDTFFSLKLDLEKVINLPEAEFKKLKKGHPVPDVTTNTGG